MMNNRRRSRCPILDVLYFNVESPGLVLYGGAYFRCRQCHRLAYQSQREDYFSRQASKARKIRGKFGDDGCFDDLFPDKPEGMHWTTYNRLADEAERLEAQVDHAFAILVARFLRQ